MRVTAFTAKRVGIQVIAGEIISNQDGINTATYPWPEPSTLDKSGFICLENSTWGSKGTGSTPGETINVTTKAGKRQHVTVGDILTDCDGIQIASIADPKNNQQ